MSLEQSAKKSTAPLDAPHMEDRIPQNLSKLDLEYRWMEIENKRIEYAHELFVKGLDNGKKGVYAAFFSFGVVFVMSLVTYYTSDKSFMSAQQLLWLSAIMCATLITYFGFIFGYSLYLKADFGKKQLNAGSKKEP